MVVLLELIALSLRAISANRRHVNQASSEFNKSSSARAQSQYKLVILRKYKVPLDRNIQVGDIVQTKVQKLLQVIVAQVIGNALPADQLDKAKYYRSFMVLP